MSKSNHSPKPSPPPRGGPRGGRSSPRHLWSKDGLQAVQGDTVRLSVVFTWHLPAAADIAYCLNLEGYGVTAGGPAVRLMPNYLEPYAHIGGPEANFGHWPGALQKHNPLATRTTLGCIRRCPWCSAWRIEGDFQELKDWEPAPLVIDNNLLASSRRHFDTVIDRLKPVPRVDFNQGLDARLLTQHHAQRLAELDLAYIRLAWDTLERGYHFLQAYTLLRNAGMPKQAAQLTNHDSRFTLPDSGKP